jgi:hypothetical protein
MSKGHFPNLQAYPLGACQAKTTGQRMFAYLDSAVTGSPDIARSLKPNLSNFNYT